MTEKSVNKDASLYTFYSWNENIEKEELFSQMKDFAELGITGVFIHARGGLSFEYFGDRWFDSFSYAVEVAKQLNIEVGIYDENGWPSGFGNGYVNGLGVDYWQKKLRVERSLPCVDNIVLLASYKKFNDEYIVCDKKDGEIFAFVELNSGYVDLLSEKVTEAFILSTHEVYKKKFGSEFGKTIKYVFTDEPQLAVPYAYTNGIEEIFLKEYGYDMVPNLWRLAFDTNSFSQFHYDYRSLTSRLFHRNFTKKISDWCAENRLLLTGHFACEENTRTLNLNGGVLNGYKFMQVPGVDALGNRVQQEQLFEQLVSAKNIFGKKDVLSETFGCSGWGTTFADFKYLWANQAVRGVTFPCLHLSAYSIKGIRKRDYPAFFSYQEPWWTDLAVLLDFMKKSAGFVRSERYSDVLVISSNYSATGITPECQADIQLSSSYNSLVSALVKNQIAFDIIDGEIFDEVVKIEEKKLKARNKTYKALIISSALFLTKKTRILIKDLVDNGIPVAIVDNYCNIDACKADNIFSTCDSVKDFFWKTNYARTIAAYNRYGETDEDIVVRRYKNGFAYFNGNRNAVKKIRIYAANCDSLKNILNEDDGYISLDDGYADIEMQPGQLLLAEKCDRQDVFKNKTIEYLAAKNIKKADKNAVTIDTGRYSLDRKNYSDKLFILDIEEKLSKESIASVWIKYTFNTDYIPDDLSVAIENEAKEIYVNGVLCNGYSKEWFVDKSIKVLNISRVAVLGENVVEVLYSTNSNKIVSSEALDSENEINRNLFSFNLEVENIYILGSFFVEQNSFKKKVETIYTDRPDFTIVKEHLLSQGDLTEQGLWFYRGRIVFNVSVPVISVGEKGYIKIIDGEQCSARIRCDDTLGEILISSDECVDITACSGKELEIELTISNRNLLGPHHHILGEPAVVGGNTYRGVRGFEDEFLASRYLTTTRVSGYHFRRNVFPKIEFIIKTKKD